MVAWRKWDTQTAMEIYADDEAATVRTVGRIDDEQMFYLFPR